MNIDLDGETIQHWNFTKKESVNIDLNEDQIFKLKFHKVKKV